MAKQVSLNVGLYGEVTNDSLKEVLNGVIENIQVSAVSEALKAVNGSGTPTAGSVEYKRFANATLEDLGTARTARAGTKLNAKPVIVNIDTDKEIVEEVADKDVKLYGIEGIAARRSANHAKRASAFLDREFFAEVVVAGTQVARGSLTAAKDIVDALIVKAKTTASDFVDGIDAEDLAIVLNADFRKEMKNSLDLLPNGTTPSNGLIGMYDSVQTFESNRLPVGVNAIVMLKGAVAQPYYMTDYGFEKINLSDSFAIELFLHAGTKALVEEAIYFDAEASFSI